MLAAIRHQIAFSNLSVSTQFGHFWTLHCSSIILNIIFPIIQNFHMIVLEGTSKLLTALYCERTIWQVWVLQVVIWRAQSLSQKLNSLISQVILPQIQFYKALVLEKNIWQKPIPGMHQAGRTSVPASLRHTWGESGKHTAALHHHLGAEEISIILESFPGCWWEAQPVLTASCQQVAFL